MATRDTKRRAVRPNDPHLAQLQAVEKIIPRVDQDLSESEAQDEAEELPVPHTPDMGSDTAHLLARMQKQLDDQAKELAELRSRPGAGPDDSVKDAGPGGYPWQYYKRPVREGDLMSGWVVYAPGGATPTGQRDVGSYTKYTGSKGFKALTRYGVCPVPQAGGRSEFIPMLEHGGAVEFPIAQVIAYRWHVNPPLPGLRFPDYEAHKSEVQHFMCEDCDYEMYFVESDKEASSACFRHLRNNSRDGRHNMRREEAVMVLRSQGITPTAGRFAEAAARREVEGLAREPSE